jgi:tRNA (cytidine/uridine-2'-O-)-methyltransferase
MIIPQRESRKDEKTRSLAVLQRPSRPVPVFMFHIVLVAPEIPPNTGNVIRLSANTGCDLHLIEPLGFSMDDKALRRAGLDYHEYAKVRKHANWNDFLTHTQANPNRMFACTTRGNSGVYDIAFQPGDWLVFGSETQGLPESVREQMPAEQLIRLPMRPDQRSMNLSNAVAVVVFEAWRQNGFSGAQQ